MRDLIALPLSVALILGLASPSDAQEPAQNPGAWRPLVHTDLKTERPDNLTYIDIWKDAISANNRAHAAKGAPRRADENASASEAHVVVRSPRRTFVLTTLDTELACKSAPFPGSAGVTIKLCPTRLVMFEGAISSQKEMPPSCYLEGNAALSPDPGASGSYAAYDASATTIKIGVIVNHKPIDECAQFIPISP